MGAAVAPKGLDGQAFALHDRTLFHHGLIDTQAALDFKVLRGHAVLLVVELSRHRRHDLAGIGQRSKGRRLAAAGQLLCLCHVQPGNAGIQHDRTGGIEVDRRARRQQGDGVAQQREAACRQAQPAQLFQALRHQGGKVVLAGIALGQAQILGQAGQFGAWQAELFKKLGERAQGWFRYLAVFHQVHHVHATLQVGDAPGQKDLCGGIGGVCQCSLVGSQKGGQTGLFQWHGPRFAQVVGTAGTGIFAQDQSSPVQRTSEHPQRLASRTLGGFHLYAAPLLPQGG